MPIYAYRCSACGHAKDVLQRISDPLLTVCPACNAPAFEKQVTAAGFQLKGSGWYVTDFKGDGGKAAKGPSEPANGEAGKGDPGKGEPGKTEPGKSEPAKASGDSAKSAEPAASTKNTAGEMNTAALAPAPSSAGGTSGTSGGQ